ncbi:hypothetical protein V8F63_09800 [Brevundimonas sp. LF-1]|uniref:hypothetical protein n=1 Tax=Brevundimonas sp. LF-1 TaxID=3126100 RepID=UPI0030E3900A
MRCYAVTEMELRQLGQAAIFVTLFSSLGSLALGLSLDVFKDIYIGDAADASALRVANLVQKGAFIAGVVCFLVAGAFALQRKSVTDLIKRESKT